MSPDAFKVYTLRMIEKAAHDRSEGFLDAWARQNAKQRGFSIKEARKQLDVHIKRGHFDRKFSRRSSSEAELRLAPAERQEIGTIVAATGAATGKAS